MIFSKSSLEYLNLAIRIASFEPEVSVESVLHEKTFIYAEIVLDLQTEALI